MGRATMLPFASAARLRPTGKASIEAQIPQHCFRGRAGPAEKSHTSRVSYETRVALWIIFPQYGRHDDAARVQDHCDGKPCGGHRIVTAPSRAEVVSLSEHELRFLRELEEALKTDCPSLARKFKRLGRIRLMRRTLVRLLCLTAAVAWQRDGTGALP